MSKQDCSLRCKRPESIIHLDCGVNPCFPESRRPKSLRSLPRRLHESRSVPSIRGGSIGIESFSIPASAASCTSPVSSQTPTWRGTPRARVARARERAFQGRARAAVILCCQVLGEGDSDSFAGSPIHVVPHPRTGQSLLQQWGGQHLTAYTFRSRELLLFSPRNGESRRSRRDRRKENPAV